MSRSSEELKDVGLELRIDQGKEREKKKEEALRKLFIKSFSFLFI